MKRSIAGAIAFLALTTLVVAQPGPRREGPHQGRMPREMADIAEMLSLTPEQETKFDKLRSEHQKSMIRKEADVRMAQVDLQNLMKAEQPDRNKIAATMKEVSDLQHGQKLAWLDHMFEVRALLTPEQLKIWKEHHRGDERWMEGPGQGERFGHHRGCWGCGGEGEM